MPNTGKPSKDCHLCRSRRVKCDLAKPACQRCFKYGVPCPGYRTEQELVFRNADPASVKKRKKRGQQQEKQGVKQGSEATFSVRLSPSTTAPDYSTPSALLDDDFDEIVTQSETSTFVCSDFVSSDFTSSDVIPSDTALILPKSLSEHWTVHSVPILLNVYSTLDFLNNIYKSNPPDGPLVWAAHLFSRTYVTNLQYSTAMYKDSVRENDQELGTYLGKTLSSVNIALKSPGGAMRDDVLATVWILTNYELLMGSINRTEPLSPWHLHARGLYSILKARGTEWLRSPTGRTGFWPAYNMVQVQCLLVNSECPPESAEWLRVIKEVMYPGEAIGYKVCLFITKVAQVQARILAILLGRDFAGASAAYHDLVGAMAEAEEEMEEYFKHNPTTSEYFDPYMRNMYCSTCVKGYHILMSYTNFLTHHIASPIPLGVLKALRLRCIQLVRTYAQEIVDSLPRCLNQKVFRKNASPKALFEALKLIWPLTAVYMIPSTLPTQKELAEKSLRFIGRELGVRQALRAYAPVNIFPPEANEPLDVIKDDSYEGFYKEG